MVRRGLGRPFELLWASFAVSSYGTWLGFGAFAIVAVQVLHEGPAQVAALASAGLAVGALLALPIGPWVEFRRKRPVMIAMDLTRFGALTTLPVAYALGALTFGQLLVVSVVVAASKIAFGAASGAFVKDVVDPSDLLRVNSRFESTTWSATVVGPTLGGAMVGLFGPVVTICADAASYLFSACGIAAIGRDAESRPPHRPAQRVRFADVADGWRYIGGHRSLRLLFVNVVAVNGLIMAGEPLLAVLMLGDLGFSAWQYGLAFSVPCLGGLIGARCTGRMVARFGTRGVLFVAGAARACWPIGLAFVGSGVVGLAVVMITEFGLIFCCSLFNSVFATYRQQQTPVDRLARVLTSWSISTSLSIAAITALGGLLAAATSARIALVVAGLLLLLTPVVLLGLRLRAPSSVDSADVDAESAART